MGLLSFLSRRSAQPAMIAAETEALRTRIGTMSTLLDDVSAELVRMRRREDAQFLSDFLDRVERIEFIRILDGSEVRHVYHLAPREGATGDG